MWGIDKRGTCRQILFSKKKTSSKKNFLEIFFHDGVSFLLGGFISGVHIPHLRKGGVDLHFNIPQKNVI